MQNRKGIIVSIFSNIQSPSFKKQIANVSIKKKTSKNGSLGKPGISSFLFFFNKIRTQRR